MFGYKLNAVMDADIGPIRELETTPASVQDSRLDLSRPGEVVYWERGYFGVDPRRYDVTMRRRTEGSSTGYPGQAVEHAYQKEGPHGEAPAVLKREFGVDYVLVATMPRVHVKMVFTGLCFNILILSTLEEGLRFGGLVV